MGYRTNSAKILIDYLYTGAGLYLNRKYEIALKCLNTNIKTRENAKYRLKQYNESFSS